LFDGDALFITGDTKEEGSQLLLSCFQNSMGVGLTTVCQFASSSGNSAVFDYFIQENGTKAMRSGEIIAVWDGTNSTFTEYSTPDLNGSTAPFRFNVTISGADVIVEGNVASGTWKAHIATRIVF
jgi:hypothetical protein